MIEELPAPQSNSSQMIEHHIFGKGKVLSFDNKRKVYTILFDGMKQPRAINAEYFSQTHNTLAIEAPVPVEHRQHRRRRRHPRPGLFPQRRPLRRSCNRRRWHDRR